MESSTQLTWEDDSVMLVTPVRAVLAKRGLNAGVMVGFLASLSFAVSWGAYSVIKDGLLESPDASIYLLSLGFTCITFAGLAFLVWLFAYRGRNVTIADAAGIRTDTRIGARTTQKRTYAWNKIASVRLEPDSSPGRVSFQTAMGPGYLATGVDTPTAEHLVAVLESWRGAPNPRIDTDSPRL